jgi:hypothetical protein
LPDYFTLWIEPPVVPERLRQLAAVCRRVSRKNEQGGIPYAFSCPEGASDVQTSAFLLGPTRFGLTCATFVLALLEHAGLALVQLDSWPSGRAGDEQWQMRILADLEKCGASKEHLEHVRQEIGSVRYRPEEVAAAATIAPPPAVFKAIERLAEAIVAKIRQVPP